MNKKNIVFFLVLLSLIIIVFGFLFFVGFMNYFNMNIIKKYPIFDFTFLPKIVALFYLLALVVILGLVLFIIIKIIISLKHEGNQLTAINLDDISVKNNTEELTESYNKLVDSLDKKISAIKQYTEIIDGDLNKMEKANLESNLQKVIESLYQNFSHMSDDLLQSSSLSELFDRTIYWGVSLTNSVRGSIMLVNNKKELYIFKTIGWDNEEKRKINDIKIPLGSGIAGKVAAENKRIFVTNIENYEDFDFKYKDKYKTKSFISMPIVGMKNVVAVLNITENKAGLYSINDLEILNTITKLSSKVYELIQLKKRIIIK